MYVPSKAHELNFVLCYTNTEIFHKLLHSLKWSVYTLECVYIFQQFSCEPKQMYRNTLKCNLCSCPEQDGLTSWSLLVLFWTTFPTFRLNIIKAPMALGFRSKIDMPIIAYMLEMFSKLLGITEWLCHSAARKFGLGQSNSIQDGIPLNFWILYLCTGSGAEDIFTKAMDLFLEINSSFSWKKNDFVESAWGFTSSLTTSDDEQAHSAVFRFGLMRLWQGSQVHGSYWPFYQKMLSKVLLTTIIFSWSQRNS